MKGNKDRPVHNQLPTLGAQLMIFGGHLDLETQTAEVLDVVQAAGYGAVEGGARDALRYRKMLDERGLRYGGSHVTPKVLANVTPLIDYLSVMDAHDICNSGLLDWNNRTLEDYRATINVLNEAGRKLRDEGIHLHYHNHEFEFEKIDGEMTGMDLLLESLDPQAIDLCVDVAWVHKGGLDPADYLRKNADRIGYLHFKDYDETGWKEVGQGILDWPPILAALSELPHVRWVMVEQDKTEGDPRKSIGISRQFLSETFGY